jgi:hypothetical protein
MVFYLLLTVPFGVKIAIIKAQLTRFICLLICCNLYIIHRQIIGLAEVDRQKMIKKGSSHI